MIRRSAVAVVVIAVVSLAAWAFVIRPALDTPERRVGAYLAATSSGNEGAALDAWVPYPATVLISVIQRGDKTDQQRRRLARRFLLAPRRFPADAPVAS